MRPTGSRDDPEEFTVTSQKGQHLKRTTTAACIVFGILASCACAGEPETKSEMNSPSKVTAPSVSEPPIPSGPFIADARCEKICEAWNCEERRRRPKPTKTLGDPPTPERLEKHLSITPLDHPDRPEFLFNLAKVSFEASQYRLYLSCEQQRQCVALNERDAPLSESSVCWATAAKDYKRSERYLTKAFKTYQQVLELPDFSDRDDALFYASFVHDELGYHDRARLLRKELLETFPESAYVPIIMRDYAQ